MPGSPFLYIPARSTPTQIDVHLPSVLALERRKVERTDLSSRVLQLGNEVLHSVFIEEEGALCVIAVIFYRPQAVLLEPRNLSWNMPRDQASMCIEGRGVKLSCLVLNEERMATREHESGQRHELHGHDPDGVPMGSSHHDDV